MFRKKDKDHNVKKIFQWQEYLNWNKLTTSQKLNFKRACLFPLLAIIVYNFLSEFKYALLIFIAIFYLIRLNNKNKISR